MLTPAVCVLTALLVVDVDQNRLTGSIDRAIEHLRASQAEDGSWSAPLGPGVTGVVLTGLLRSGRVPVDDPMIKRGFGFLLGLAKQDGPNKGGIYDESFGLKNYSTSVALMALVEANDDGRFDEPIAAARRFMRGMQWNENQGYDSTHDWHGGAGYGSHKRPDLSNTQFWVESMRVAGIPADDPDMQKALVFLSRCQNLSSKHNDRPFAKALDPDDEGGFVYTAVGQGESKAGRSPAGGLRSYGSMTYAALKSMVYAGLDAKDERVAAALKWIRSHYTLDHNPGMGQQGLYYYYMTFGRALRAFGQDTVTDRAGKTHSWRAELAAALLARQRADGFWVNQADRWYEGDPNLVTGYALIALATCRK